MAAAGPSKGLLDSGPAGVEATGPGRAFAGLRAPSLVGALPGVTVALAVAPGVFGVLVAGECPGFLGELQREREPRLLPASLWVRTSRPQVLRTQACLARVIRGPRGLNSFPGDAGRSLFG